MGKTTVVSQLVDRLREQAVPVVHLNLRGVSSEDRLLRLVFGDPQFQTFLTTDSTLHLVLDSLDECALQLPAVAAVLGDELVRHLAPLSPSQRLKLRVRFTCRTADWPEALESALEQVYARQVAAYELAPLRALDVQTFARAEGLDALRFQAAVQAAEVVPLVIRLVTLQLLTKQFAQHGQLPTRAADLYRLGLLTLCEEPSAHRRDQLRLRPGQVSLSSPEKLAVAQRLASISVFSQRDALWTGAQGDALPEDVSIADINAGAALDAPGRIGADLAVRQVVQTGLFKASGERPQRSTWAHQTYAEYLSASDAAQTLTLHQLQQLLFTDVTGQLRIVPQLAQVATWIAGVRSDFAQLLARVDPEILIESDAFIKTDTERAQLVEGLFEAKEAGRISAHFLVRPGRAKELTHPGLADQLRLYLNGTQFSYPTRFQAIRIAQYANVQDLIRDLLTLARSNETEKLVRYPALHAVVSLLPTEKRIELQTFVLGKVFSDSYLQEIALEALWPQALSLKEVLTHLQAPDRERRTGFTPHLLAREDFWSMLQTEDMVLALGWLLRQDKPAWGQLYRGVFDAVLVRSWAFMDDQRIQQAMARLVVQTLQNERRFISSRPVCSRLPDSRSWLW